MCTASCKQLGSSILLTAADAVAVQFSVCALPAPAHVHMHLQLTAPHQVMHCSKAAVKLCCRLLSERPSYKPALALAGSLRPENGEARSGRLVRALWVLIPVLQHWPVRFSSFYSPHKGTLNCQVLARAPRPLAARRRRQDGVTRLAPRRTRFRQRLLTLKGCGR